MNKEVSSKEEQMKGLWDKYIITKTSGKPLADGFYAIVLRVDGGQYVDACRAGALAFAEAVRDENPLLSSGIQDKITSYMFVERFSKAEGRQEGE